MSNKTGVRFLFGLYWAAYGGLKALLLSPYFWLALIVTGLTCHFWAHDLWWDQVISVIPNLLGFTLGGFAIFLGFGDERFKAVISGSRGETHSPYLKFSATFMHFILIQSISLISAVCAKALDFRIVGRYSCISDILSLTHPYIDALGYFFFVYTLCTVVAAGMAVFRVSYWFDEGQTRRLNAMKQSAEEAKRMNEIDPQ